MFDMWSDLFQSIFIIGIVEKKHCKLCLSEMEKVSIHLHYWNSRKVKGKKRQLPFPELFQSIFIIGIVEKINELIEKGQINNVSIHLHYWNSRKGGVEHHQNALVFRFNPSSLLE